MHASTSGLNDQHLARLLDALCLAHAGFGVRRSGNRSVEFDTVGVRVEIFVEHADVDGAFVRHPDFALRHVVRGDLEVASEASVGERLDEIARDLSTLATLIFGGSLPQKTAANPARLIPMVNVARRVWIEHKGAPDVQGLPPCLDIAMRPDEPRRPFPNLAALPPPCDDCSHALWCPANAGAGDENREGLRPLRHREHVSAALAALRAICSAWNVPTKSDVANWIDEMVAMRRGVSSGPRPPFELSLKREDNRLAPLLRIVDIAPWELQSPSYQPACIHRRNFVRSSACARNDSPSARAVDEFIELVEAEERAPACLSYGIETPVYGGPLRTQLYAHLRAGAEQGTRRLARAAFLWSGASESDISKFSEFCEKHSAALFVHSPAPDDPRRCKIYFPTLLDHRDEKSGLESLKWPSYAPNRGMAVLQCGARGIQWEKWDFPCAVQFQSAGVIFEDFISGMPEEEAHRVKRITDGRDFVLWPTWMSIRPAARTIYFSPR